MRLNLTILTYFSAKRSWIKTTRKTPIGPELYLPSYLISQALTRDLFLEDVTLVGALLHNQTPSCIAYRLPWSFADCFNLHLHLQVQRQHSHKRRVAHPIRKLQIAAVTGTRAPRKSGSRAVPLPQHLEKTKRLDELRIWDQSSKQLGLISRRIWRSVEEKGVVGIGG